jgi:hypothetical protein
MATRTKQGQPTRQASKQTTKQLTTKQLLYCTVLYWCTNACNLVDDRTGQVRVPVGEGVGPTPMSQQVQNRRAGEFVPIRSDAIRHAMARSQPQHCLHVPPPRAYKYILKKKQRRRNSEANHKQPFRQPSETNPTHKIHKPFLRMLTGRFSELTDV